MDNLKGRSGYSRSDQVDEEVFLLAGKQEFRLGIVLSGQVLDETGFLRALSGCDLIVCADGGARHLHRYGILPDLLVGDMDSITDAAHNWLAKAQVPVRQFKPEKDFTDSELAVTSSLELLESLLHEQNSTMPQADAVTICMLAITGDRPDHVLANQLMGGKLAQQGYSVIMTDGRNWFFPLHGPVSKIFDVSLFAKDCTISVVALAGPVRGLTYSGLKYPLNNYSLLFGSQRGVSNCLEPSAEEFAVSMTEGTMMLIITKNSD